MSYGMKKERILEIFYRLITGTGVSVAELANEYEVTTKSISRDITEIKNFIADHRGLLGNAEILYDSSLKKYFLHIPQFFETDELFAVLKILIGCRAFSKKTTLEIIYKMKQFTSVKNQKTIDKLISKELYHFNEIKHDCQDLLRNLWNITLCIEQQNEMSISYYKMNREYVERRVRPIAITFTDYYFYLIGYQELSKEDNWEIRYFRIDRIVHIIKHRTKFVISNKKIFDEGDLMSKIQLMFPGEPRHIKFEFTGPSVQAILDKIPTARLVEIKNGKNIIEADVYGTGINMLLLSQGSWVKVLEPKEFVVELKDEIRKMNNLYNQDECKLLKEITEEE